MKVGCKSSKVDEDNVCVGFSLIIPRLEDWAKKFWLFEARLVDQQMHSMSSGLFYLERRMLFMLDILSRMHELSDLYQVRLQLHTCDFTVFER